MCRGNDELRVCASSINHLLGAGNARMVFGPACNRAMWQHVIRFKLKPTRAAVAAVGWDGPDGLYQRMFLRRPDGQPWSDSWDRVVMPRVQEAIQRRAKDAITFRLVAEVPNGGEPVWADWAQGFLSSEWDGISKDEKSGRALLALAGPVPDPVRTQGGQQDDSSAAKQTEDDSEGADSGIDLSTDQPREDESRQPREDESEGSEGSLNRHVRRWLQDAETNNTIRSGRSGWLSVPSLPQIPELEAARTEPNLAKAYPHPPPPSVSPWDSTSQVSLQVSGAIPYIARDPNAIQASEEDKDEDDEVARWAASLSLQELAELIYDGVDNMAAFNREVVKVQVEAASYGTSAGLAARENELRQEREVLLEQMCFLEDLMDSKLRDKHGRGEGAPGTWPFSGIFWSNSYSDPEHRSPILEKRTEQRNRQVLE
ncbi:hypothetical protein QBC39DRAFT_436700 [Podospora conica]|nr:hypothetical protein QBC39DRAFT_436700 [Schizothecium conicum]